MVITVYTATIAVSGLAHERLYSALGARQKRARISEEANLDTGTDDHEWNHIRFSSGRFHDDVAHDLGSRIEGKLEKRCPRQISDDGESRDRGGEIGRHLGKGFYPSRWPLKVKPARKRGESLAHDRLGSVNQLDLAGETGQQN